MITKRLICILIAILGLIKVQAQTIEGQVKDAKTSEPLPFVNVGIIKKSIGTVTDEKGHFKLALNNNTDTLRISILGYAPQTLMVADVLKNPASIQSLTMQPVSVMLKEVRVGNHKWKEVILGSTKESKTSNAGFNSNQLGNEIGTIIKIKKAPTYLKRFNTYIAANITDTIKLRLNFYTVKDGLPDQLLQNQNIYVTVVPGQERISVDLLPYNIEVDDRFFVSLEWIKRAKGVPLMFSAGLFGNLISRNTSQDKWEKIGFFGLGFNVLAEY